MVSLSQNTIVVDQRKKLTRTQQDAVKAIAFYRRQRKGGRVWLVGDKRISVKLISDLERLDLVGEGRLRGESVLRLTTAGSLVAERLRQ